MSEKVISAPKLPMLKKAYINKWVALSPDFTKLLGVGETLSAVLKIAPKTTKKVVIKVLPNLGYAPSTIS